MWGYVSIDLPDRALSEGPGIDEARCAELGGGDQCGPVGHPSVRERGAVFDCEHPFAPDTARGGSR